MTRSSDSSFEPQLARFRFWNRLGIAALLCGVPSLIALTMLARFIAYAPVLLIIVFVAMTVTLFTARVKIWAFRCPDCGLPFTRKTQFGQERGRGRKCVHCALAAYPE